MILVNEPADKSKIRLTKEEILRAWDLEHIDERPTKVVTVTTGMSSGDIGQMYKELSWFHEIECKYASGDVWVSLSVSTFMPPVVRRTATVLKLVESYLG